MDTLREVDSGNALETSPSPLRGIARAHAVQAVILNAPFLLAYPDRPVIESMFLRSLLINSVLFLVPGVSLVALAMRNRRDMGFRLLWMVAGSLLVFVSVLLTLHAAGVRVAANNLWIGTWLVTDLLLVINASLRGPVLIPFRLTRASITAMAVFAVAYALFFAGASRIVPVLGDQDDELQRTAYGLMVRLKPSAMTGRNTEYLFAHPPLAHVYAAEALTYYGLLEELEVFDSQSERRLSPRDAYARFASSPHLLETRTPSIFFSALTVALLAALVLSLTRSTWLGAASAMLYATFPEVFVRSSYAGYFAIAGFFGILTLLALERWIDVKDEEARWACVVTGAFCALADHKMVLLPIAIVVWSWLRSAGQPMATRLSVLLHPVAIGFLAGTVAFWIYGLVISPADFWADHVRHHIVDRIVHNNARGFDMSRYPGIVSLWREFVRDTGYFLVPLGFAGLLQYVLSRRKRTAAGHSEREGPMGAGAWLSWGLLTAVAFSLVDWRQTKHLAPMALPLTLGFALLTQSRRTRLVMGVVILLLLSRNLAVLRSLTIDFSAVTKVPEW